MYDGRTITAILQERLIFGRDQRALGFIHDGHLHWQTWDEVVVSSARFAAHIQTTHVQAGDCVVQISENRYEWIITDLAIHLAGAVHVPLHVTLSAEQMAAQIVDCGAKLVIVSNRELLEKIRKGIDPAIGIWVHNEQGAGREEALLEIPAVAHEKAHSPGPDDLATILYTSGTTGRARGVMLSHRNLAANASAAAAAFGGGSDETRLCILPLSHIYARTCDLYTWICRGSRLVLGESRETIARDLQLVRPTAMNAVPYIYQRIAEQIRASGCSDEAGAMRAFFGGRMERLTCGGASLSPDVEAWYAERGLPIHCGYGLTEASPVISVSPPGQTRRGSVGRALANVEIRIAEDGEVLCRGPNVMMGYWDSRGAGGGSEAIRDGWLHTGDLGELDADGYLFIRGRKKELIVLSTGKKVFPSRIESLLCMSPQIEQAAVFGDGRPCLGALIVPARRATQLNRDEIAAEVERCLQGAAKEEQVRRFTLVERPFASEFGEITPKLSLCRPAIAKNFAAELESLWE